MRRMLPRSVTGAALALSEPSAIHSTIPLPQDPEELSAFAMFMECHQPLLLEVSTYLLKEPKDFLRLGCVSATLLLQLVPHAGNLWSGLYQLRWPAFHSCLQYQGVKAWRHVYQKTLSGAIECSLEVFDREKKLGFAMAAMPGRVQYERIINSYIVTYISASEVPPEVIPKSEESRLRFCPKSAWERLQPCRSPMATMTIPGTVAADSERREASPPSSSHKSPSDGKAAYPYKVYEGLDGLEVGNSVELQWKMQEGSPFGWWCGKLEALRHDPDGTTAMATIVFTHFPSRSRWYRLNARVGGPQIRQCDFGGLTGGLRPVSAAEDAVWAQFFPRRQLVF